MRAIQWCLLLALCGCGAKSGKQENATTQKASQNDVSIAIDQDDCDTIISGVVVNTRQEPLADAAVSAVFLSHRSATDPLAGSTVAIEGGRATTNATGCFRMSIRRSAPQDIALELSASAKGYGISLLDLETGEGSHDVTLVLPNETSLTAVLEAPNGAPLAAATIKLCRMLAVAGVDEEPAWYSAPVAGAAAWPASYVTERDGSFSLISGSSIMKMELEIDDERVARQRWIVASDDDADRLIIRTEPARFVEGQVVAGNSRTPLAEASVVLTSWSDNQFVGNVATKTDANGQFALRPFVGNYLGIRVTAPDAQLRPLQRRIPWLDGTTTQRMVLPIHGAGFDPEDGTTPDGRLVGTIDADYPTATLVQHRPTEPLTARLSGTIVAQASLKTRGPDSVVTVSGLIAIDPTSGRWRLLAENGGSPRVSPDGKQLLSCSSDFAKRLEVVELGPTLKPRQIEGKCDGPASWLPNSDTFVANICNPPPQDYFGQQYWAQESEKWRLDLTGKKLGEIAVPSRYDVFDVSSDGRLLAMHYDTHASLTGAQLFIAQADGSDVKPIARKRYQYYWYPRFSPDGKRILAKHLKVRESMPSVRVLALDGSIEESILLDDAFGPEIGCWSPDGNYIAIVGYPAAAFSGGRKLSKLFVVDALGSRIKEVAIAGADELWMGSIDWTKRGLTE